MTVASRPLSPGSRHSGSLRNIPGLKHDQRGVAALEFALLAPFLITAVLGLVAVSQAVRAKMLLDSAASSMASMVAAERAVTGGNAGTLRDFCNGAQLVMKPYAISSLAMAVTSYTRETGNKVTQDWEYRDACQSSAGSMSGSGAALANSLLTEDGDSVIIVQASYRYTSSSSELVPNMTLDETAYSRPRYSKVTCVACR